MGIDGALRRMFDAIRRSSARRAARVELVAWRPLHAGSVLYVADFDRRRYAFVVGPSVACSLASYVIEDQAPLVDGATGVRDGAV